MTHLLPKPIRWALRHILLPAMMMAQAYETVQLVQTGVPSDSWQLAGLTLPGIGSTIMFLAACAMMGAALQCAALVVAAIDQQRWFRAAMSFFMTLFFTLTEIWANLSERSLHIVATPADLVVLALLHFPAHAALTPTLFIVSAFIPLTVLGFGLTHAPFPAKGAQPGVVPEIGMGLPPSLVWPVEESPAPGAIMLGNGEEGPIYGTLDDLLATGVIGKPGRGKSTLLCFLIAQFVKIGTSVVVWDPHAGLAELASALPCYDTANRITESAAQVEQELQRRKQQRKQGAAFTPFLLVVDELPVISESAPRAVDAIKHLILEGRKYQMYTVIAGQGLPARLLGDTLARDMLSSRYIFESSDLQAKMAGLDSTVIKRLMPQLRNRPGTAILDCARRNGPEIVTIPNTPVSAILDALAARPSQPAPEASSKPAQGALWSA